MTGIPTNLIRTPDAETSITTQVVRRLLHSQHPDLAALPIQQADSGWDNCMFRLGDDLAVRLPRRKVANQLLRNEQLWLPRLAPRLPLPIPAPVRQGLPEGGYPFHWSVVPWLPGDTADLAAPGRDQGPALAAFYRALHQSAPADAPTNTLRGIPLAGRVVHLQERLTLLPAAWQPLLQAALPIWHQALAQPLDQHPCWLHGDSHARNLLVQNSRFSAVVDWGDICSGDRATDLAVVWSVLPERHTRDAFIAAYPASAATWARAMGWAFLFGVVLLHTGLNGHPRHARMGEQTLRRLLDSPEPRSST